MTEAQKRANAKWNKEHYRDYTRIVIVLSKEYAVLKDKAKERADALGISVSDYVRRLIKTDIQEVENGHQD